MSVVEEIRKVNSSEFALVWGIILAILIPGGLTVLFHREDLFTNLSILKICMLAAAFTLPLIVVNFIAMDGTIDPSKGGSTLVDAMAISCIPTYLSLLTAFLFGFACIGHIVTLVVVQGVVFYLIKVIAKHEK